MSRIFRPYQPPASLPLPHKGRRRASGFAWWQLWKMSALPEGPQWDRKEQLFPVGGHRASSSPPFSEGDIQRQK